MNLNPNDRVRVKPTETGWQQIMAHVDAFNDHIRQSKPNLKYRMSLPVADADGYIKDQFWRIMQFFDWSRGLGSECPFSDLIAEKS